MITTAARLKIIKLWRKKADHYSVVFFHHPDLDTSIATVEARGHVMARQRNSYTLD